jgi:replicative DNA helicase
MDDMFDDPTLADPDAESEIKYSWDEDFQRHVISLLLLDRQFILQSLDLVKPNYFTNKAHQKACAITFKFFKEHRILPNKTFLIQEVKDDLKDNKSLDYYLSEIGLLYDYFQPGLDARDYLQNKIVYFAKIQAIKAAFKESLAEIDKAPENEDTWGKVYDLMRKSMETNENFDLGLDYFNTIKDRYEQMEEDQAERAKFVMGLLGIDSEISAGGYIKGEMVSFVGGSGVGKSVMLCCLTATNVLRGKNGVYITLELAAEKVADRMDAILTGFPIQSLSSHKDDIFSKLTELEGVDYKEDGLGSLVIKQFPAQTCTVNTIRSYLSQLRFHGFEPDFVVLDYIGEMKDLPGMKTYESREKTVSELRGMATEENVFLATAMQPNRGSRETQKDDRGRIEEEHLADSFGQIRPLDGCFSLNQNDVEKLLGIGRCYVIKQRDGRSRYMIRLKFDLESLKISELSQDKYLDILNSHKQSVEGDVVVDHMGSVKVTEEDKVEAVMNRGTGWAPGNGETDTIGDDSKDQDSQ